MRALILSLALVTSAYGQRVSTPSDDGNGGLCGGRASRFFRSSSGSVGPGQFCDRFTSDDKSGNWFCLNGDGTMASGSQRTLAVVGTPGSEASTCTGRTQMSFTATTQRYEQSVTEAFPSSSFSICMQLTFPTTPTGLETAAFGTGGAPGTSVVLPCEMQSDRRCKLYVSNNVSYTTLTATSAQAADTPAVVCLTYERVGGAADNVATFYLDGAANGTSSTQNLTSTLNSGWAFNGVLTNPGLGAFPFKSDGIFVTYKALAPARVLSVSAPICQ